MEAHKEQTPQQPQKSKVVIWRRPSIIIRFHQISSDAHPEYIAHLCTTENHAADKSALLHRNPGSYQRTQCGECASFAQSYKNSPANETSQPAQRGYGWSGKGQDGRPQQTKAEHQLAAIPCGQHSAWYLHYHVAHVEGTHHIALHLLGPRIAFQTLNGINKNYSTKRSGIHSE